MADVAAPVGRLRCQHVLATGGGGGSRAELVDKALAEGAVVSVLELDPVPHADANPALFVALYDVRLADQIGAAHAPPAILQTVGRAVQVRGAGRE